jgi:nicotinate phosphoribosyltransferase
MAIISELYFKLTGQKADKYELRAIAKAKEFAKIGAEISEFGTRRRFSFEVQQHIIGILKDHAGKYLNGTSNVYFAMKYNLTPIGTHPHEWFMYHGANYGYRSANALGLENWVDVYHGDLGIALTDTFTSDNFYTNFDTKYAKLFDGVRWDSGDPIEFTDKTLKHYTGHRIDPKNKTIVYSDALDLEKVKEIKKYVDGRIHDVYGIGTYLTNDVGVKPLNMVIKLTAAKPANHKKYIPAVKLSDVDGKHTGEPEEIEICLKTIKNV